MKIDDESKLIEELRRIRRLRSTNNSIVSNAKRSLKELEDRRKHLIAVLGYVPNGL